MSVTFNTNSGEEEKEICSRDLKKLKYLNFRAATFPQQKNRNTFEEKNVQLK